MSRKRFIEAHGATCRNWKWSWSFINREEHLVIFGAWDKNTEGGTSLILDESWRLSAAGRRQPAYNEALEHIRLVESGAYRLQTFPLIYSDERKDERGIGPATIKGFVPELTAKVLKKVGPKWYASDGSLPNLLPEEVSQPEKYLEGASKSVSINAYERNSRARAACIRHYGPVCSVCGFNFETFYGAIGTGFIHVHHLISLSCVREAYEVDPVNDLRPVCPNCHAMIHSTEPALTVEDLQAQLNRSPSGTPSKRSENAT